MRNPSKVVPLTPFGTFMGATPVLPSMYWDVYSAEQRWKAISELLKKLCEYVEYMGDEINVDRDTINQLLEDFEKFKESGFIDYYEALIKKWIDDNFADIVSHGLKQIYFGLTDDGYFCAYVPDSWSEVTFDTGAVFGRSDYGRLILRFDADPAHGVIDNTYGSSAAFGNAQLTRAARELASVIDTLITDVEINARRTDEVYAAEFTNLDEVVSNGNF